jgi:biopolymer transport protein ExbD
VPLKTTHDEQLNLNLTPMIDVAFLLIIFFMLGTRFVGDEQKIKLNVPVVGHSPSLANLPGRFVINVTRDGQIAIDQRPVTVAQLTDELRGAGEKGTVSVSIRGDAEGAFQNVASVMAACRAAGVRNMAVCVRSETKSRLR